MQKIWDQDYTNPPTNELWCMKSAKSKAVLMALKGWWAMSRHTRRPENALFIPCCTSLFPSSSLATYHRVTDWKGEELNANNLNICSRGIFVSHYIILEMFEWTSVMSDYFNNEKGSLPPNNLIKSCSFIQDFILWLRNFGHRMKFCYVCLWTLCSEKHI